MAFDFEQSEIWQLSLQFVDTIYTIAGSLPADEENNLRQELKRCSTQLAVLSFKTTVAEQNSEKAKFVSQAQRALLETIAHCKIVERQQMTPEMILLHDVYKIAESMDKKLAIIREQCATKLLAGREFKLLGAVGM